MLAFSLLALVLAKESSTGWTCGSDDFWYNNGVKTTYSGCGSKDTTTDTSKDTTKDTSKDASKSTTCTDTSSGISGLPRTCINSAPNNSPRCWWTHIPSAITGTLKVPLIVDMHGGGGCAVHQEIGSGFKALADSSGTDTFVTVFPQGHNSLWGSCGSDCNSSAAQAAAAKKGADQLASTNDISFLEQMIANIVRGNPNIDPERIYVTGFSLGCMMAHRFAMERGKLVAGLGCHGGELSLVDTSVSADLDAEKTKYSIQLMPTFLTIGDQDTWLARAKLDWEAWAYWNGCSASSTKSVTLSGSSLTAATERTKSSCASYSPALQTVMLEIVGGAHATDARMAAQTWTFLKQYKRAGALAELPAAVAEVTPPATASSARALATTAMWTLIAATLVHQSSALV